MNTNTQAISEEMAATWATIEKFLDCTPKEKEMLKSGLKRLVQNTIIETQKAAYDAIMETAKGVSF